MSFLFPAILSIGLTLLALPVLIHLINLLRHRRVKWAAMDFLLQSQKKHKKWIILKQLLLLLTRVAAVAAVVFMLAQPQLRSEWGALFGGAEVHHVVLLDDSYSMSDRFGDGSAFDRAKAVVQRLGEQAGKQGSNQTFSLLRFSNSANLALGSQPDIVQETMTADFSLRLTKVLAEMQPSQTAAGPGEALDALRRLPAKTKDEDRIVYLVSDFRTREWNEPTELRKALNDLNQQQTAIHLVHCVDSTQANLGIVELKPQEGTRAAGVETFVEISVKNFGDEPAREVALQLEENGHSRPGLVIQEIGAGETVTRSFRVNFPHPGQHILSASLPGDAVLTDNTRHAVIDVPESVPVLLIDGDVKARDAYFLSAALAPGGSVRTGLRPQIETTTFLRRPEQLEKFHSIYLLNVPHLDPTQIAALETFVAEGGGLALFMGELCRASFFNDQLYRGGEGLFPLPLSLPTDLLLDRVERAPDLKVVDHPIFHTFLAMRNNPLDDVRIERYFAVPESWKPDSDSTVKVVAELRNGAPLVVEKKFGRGRVVAVLTKASPEKVDLVGWNNWARNYSYLPAVLNLQGYLAASRQGSEERTVGQPLTLTLDAAVYNSQINFATPRTDGPDIIPVDAVATAEGLAATLSDTGASGIYTASLRTLKEQHEQRHFAYNVVPEEGDLHTLDGKQLASRLDGVQYRFHRAQDLHYDPQHAAGALGDWIFYLLVGLLLGEQVLAYSASYHPPRKEAAR